MHRLLQLAKQRKKEKKAERLQKEKEKEKKEKEQWELLNKRMEEAVKQKPPEWKLKFEVHPSSSIS